MIVDKRDELLGALLNCGVLDLGMLERVEVDWFKVMERMDEEPVDFNTLMHAAEEEVLEEELITLKEAKKP
ncbi:MAG: hypothetical protein QXK12_07150 [Candidatus Nezhaarchaeales archaeon]